MAFSSLAHDARLGIYQYLVQAGPEGRAAGHIADKQGISPSNLTFHMAHLERSGLVHSRREGRSVIYSADFGTVAGLVDFLTDKCCSGQPDLCSSQLANKQKLS